MTERIAEDTYRALIRADQDQRERSERTGRTHPTYTGRWDTPEAIRCQQVLTPKRMQEIRFEEARS